MRDKLIELINQIIIPHRHAERVADHLIANGVTFATDNNVGDKGRTLSISIEEGMELEGATCSRVSFQHLYKGNVYGAYIDFKKAKLDEDDLAETFKEFAYCYTMELEMLEKGADS